MTTLVYDLTHTHITYIYIRSKNLRKIFCKTPLCEPLALLRSERLSWETRTHRDWECPFDHRLTYSMKRKKHNNISVRGRRRKHRVLTYDCSADFNPYYQLRRRTNFVNIFGRRY